MALGAATRRSTTGETLSETATLLEGDDGRKGEGVIGWIENPGDPLPAP